MTLVTVRSKTDEGESIVVFRLEDDAPIFDVVPNDPGVYSVEVRPLGARWEER